MGKTLCLGSKNKNKIPIGGVFETVPENAHQRYDAVITLQVMVSPDYDGTMNWLGNDRYRGYVKLYPGVEPDSLAEPMRAMQRKHQDFEALKKAGVDLSYTLTRLTDLHRKTPEVKSMTSLLIVLAFVLIFAAVMNYVLVVISSFVSRTKEVAVHKCYGASGRNIGGMIVSETFLHLLISIALALLLIFAFRGTVEELLAASLRALFSSQSITILVAVCMVVFLVTGLLPGHLFARIPVGAAFRNYRESRRYWKLALLFVQFIGVGFLFSFLVIITLQHRRMTNDNPGYNYEQLAYFNMGAQILRCAPKSSTRWDVFPKWPPSPRFRSFLSKNSPEITSTFRAMIVKCLILQTCTGWVTVIWKRWKSRSWEDVRLRKTSHRRTK